jgi:hypothetical protein
MKRAKAQRRAKLPLDDPRWLPILDAHKAILPRTGDWHLAARDLTAAMAKPDGVRSMRRRVKRGEGPDRELLPRSFWEAYELRPWNSRPGPFPNDSLLVCPPGKTGRAIQGYAFFVWNPDLEKIWPTAAPTAGSSEHPNDPLRPPPRRRGPVMTHDWFSICGEIARRCIDPRTGRVTVPKSENKLAEDLLKWLSEQGIDPPAPSEMREAVKRVCAALRPVQK